MIHIYNRTSVKYARLLFFCSAFSAGVFAQNVQPFTGKLVPQYPESSSGDKTPLPDRSRWIEDVSQRTVFKSVYYTPDGEYIARNSSVPINYYDATGNLVPIDYSPKKTSGGWAASAQPFPTYVSNDGTARVSVGKDEDDYFACGDNVIINGVKMLRQPLSFEGNTGTMHNVVPGVDKQFTFRLNGIKTNYVISQPQQVSGNYFTVSEEISLPHGFTFKNDDSRGRAENGGWTGDIQIIGYDGSVCGMIKAAMVYDAANNYTFGTYVIRFDNQSNSDVLDILVPKSWMNDPARAYPVTLDPLIIGPTSLWIGGSMPSCISPSFNADSINITIPAKITVTGLIVTSSFYADPFTVAVMADGLMKFKTSCNTSTTFTIAPPAGNTPGTAYLDTFDLHAPLMCCMPQSCTQGSFWLTMLLARTAPGAGCNTTYIRYDPVTTMWPFEAFVRGRTVETLGAGFTVQNAPVCSNVCTFTSTVHVHYGVPPFTITHPWMAGNVVVGTPAGCNMAITNQNITLNLPNCPWYCDTVTVVTVPPPMVIDACGDTAHGFLSSTLHIKEAPRVTSAPATDTICSGDPYNFALTACLPGSSISWSGYNTNGTGNISGSGFNSGTADTSVTFTASASLNGCFSDTITTHLVVDPPPNAAFNYGPQPCIINIPVSFMDLSNVYAGNATNWFWSFGDSTFAVSQNPVHTYTTPGTYHVCFATFTNHNCSDTTCMDVTVIPADVIPPNVVTPNGDGVNDFLNFKFLEFYTDNNLQVFDRWGVLLLNKDSYANDWSPGKYSAGTYYYILTVRNTGKIYKGFFELMK